MKIYFTFEVWFSKEKFVLRKRQLLVAANRSAIAGVLACNY